MLVLSMGVVGSGIHGQAAFGVTCSNNGTEGGSPIAMDGTVGQDGSFTIKNASTDDIQIAITGTAPEVGATTWSGHYSFSSATGAACTVQASGSFAATAFPAIDGTYAGTVYGLNSGGALTLSMKLTEAAFTSTELIPGYTYYYAPLSGTITAGGTSCFTTGATTVSPELLRPVGLVMGNEIELAFTTDTGSTFNVQGYFTDPTEKTLQMAGSVTGGKCGGQLISGTLTLQ